MSRLDDKLAASIKPARTKAAPDKHAAPQSLAAKKAAGSTLHRPGTGRASHKVDSADDLNAASPPLFPARIWPD